MTSTPPVLPVPEPPTPLHGSRYDGKPVRRSPRISKLGHNRTPSPGASRSSPPRLHASTPRDKNRARNQPDFSPPSSPLSPPKMQRTKSRNTKARESKNLDVPPQPTFSSQPTTMLPTPVKTPRKKDLKNNLVSTARVLFPNRPETVDEVMPTPRKRARKGMSLESFAEGQTEQPAIQIYTDSRDKVPEVDQSTDNPFYAKGGSTRSSKKKEKESQDHKAVQSALERDEGMVYVFRGKKIYRKFESIDYDEPDGGDSALEGMPLEGLASPKPFTRSSVKPRFLFGKKEAGGPAQKNGTASSNHQGEGGSTSDEEAPTDIEQPASDAEDEEEPEIQTPSKVGFPATPPETNRAKRVAFHSAAPGDAEEDEPAEIVEPRFTVKKARNKATPFDVWARTKSSGGSGSSSGGPPEAPVGKGKKRAAEEELVHEDGKRAKGKTGHA